MTSAAIAEYLDLWEATANMVFSDQADKTAWRRTPDGKYIAKSAYKMLHAGSILFRGHSPI